MSTEGTEGHGEHQGRIGFSVRSPARTGRILPPRIADRAEPAEYTVAFVERAVRYYKAHGREGAVAQFSSSESVDGAWYVFIIDGSGRVIAHPNPEIIGRDMKGDLGVDSSGFRYGELALSATEAGMWVDHLSVSNPTKDGSEEEVKHTWVVRYDGVFIGSGWYE